MYKKYTNFVNSPEEVERRAEQLSRNCKWLINQIDQIHSAICPNGIGTWQDRAKQAVKTAMEIRIMQNNIRKGYIKEGNEKKDCLVHGFFEWSDGSMSGPMAVIEFANGTVMEVPSQDVVFTEKYNQSLEPTGTACSLS
jgi:hypothetical protein